MKKIIFFTGIFFALLASSCNDECQTLLDDIQDAKSTYENAPSNANCLNYKSLLEKHLNGSCSSETEGVNYETLFQNYLDNLPCN